jgi:arylsulfatase A-like enzyme/cytochrome c-type biogenesis protein CcmH/NrfG
VTVPVCSRAPQQPPSVVLITIDTLRADRVGGPFTPTLNSIAASGTTFGAARATAPLTLPSHTTIMSGLLPPEHGVRQNGEVLPASRVPLLARVFRDAGYRTAAFVAAYVLNRRFGLAEGFEHYDDRIPRDPNAPTRLESERPAHDVAAALRTWLTNVDRSKPLFLWVHLYDPHAPYEAPPEFLKKASGRAYDAEVLFVDAQVASMLDEVANRIGRDFITVVAGDHGEGLGEHGESTHGMLAYDSTLRVPFLLSGPGIEKGRRIATPASLRDLAPTLLARAGLPAPSDMTGVDLLGTRKPSDVYAETVYPQTAGWSPLRVLVDERWKLIASSAPELYDTSQDPAERRDVASANPSVASAMLARADQIFRPAKAPASGGQTADAAERLRALGYVAAAPSAPVRSDAANPRDRIDLWNGFEKALSLMAARRAADALPELRALVKQAPDARVFHSTLAQALKDTGRTREAFTILRSLVSRWPDDATIFHDLAVAAREVGDAREAIRAEQAALALSPTDANAHNGLGLLHADAGRHADAAAAFDRATALDPGNASFWTNLGNARRALGDVAAADRAYRTALELSPDYADAANGRGVILVQQGRAGEAVPFFERAVTADPALYEAQLNLGIALQESGDRTRAAEQYRRVLSAAPAGSHEKRAASELLAALQR